MKLATLQVHRQILKLKFVKIDLREVTVTQGTSMKIKEKICKFNLLDSSGISTNYNDKISEVGPACSHCHSRYIHELK